MAYAYDRLVEHLLCRAGFGARPDERETYARLSVNGAIDRLVDYEEIPDTVDDRIGQPGYLGTNNSGRGPFDPRTLLIDARQRWLFRMVHSDRPLQEKMTLFWHNHFATSHSKISGMLGAGEATRYMAAKASEDPQRVQGQIEMLRANALGNFEQILTSVARDVAMMYWLDNRLNVRDRPQENFAREIMELFTMGVGHYTEADVYAAARVFTGWNLGAARGTAPAGTQFLEFLYNGAQHDTAAKTFTFAIYPDGGRTIPARSSAAGMQDGLDFIAGLVRNPNTGRYLAAKLYRFFVSETGEVSGRFVDRISAVYSNSQHSMKAVVRAVLQSPEFWDASARAARFSWPVEFVARVLKGVASRRYQGYSVFNALTPLSNMGQNLYDPPDVAGWDLGRGWFSTGSMLARMNFASAVAANQRSQLVEWLQPFATTPDRLVSEVVDALAPEAFDGTVRAELANYLRSTGPWTGAPAQLQVKAPGLVHLVTGSAEYQLV